jgi:hypothetical protein
MSKHQRLVMGLGLAAGVVLGLAPGCAGKGKGSRNPAQCMSRCEQDECGYDPNEAGNDEYLACLEACESRCG